MEKRNSKYLLSFKNDRSLKLKKIISYSLYGQKPKYLEGLKHNIDLLDEVFQDPSLKIRVYYDDSVPESKLIKHDRVEYNKVINDVNYIDGHGNKGWNTDQLHLYKRVLEWNKNTNNFVHLYDTKTGYMRLDRINFEFDKTKIKNGYYSDYHCCRPYDKYKSINDEIINAL